MTTTPAPSGTAPVLLPGQAAALPGPCDMTGMYLMHHAFRRDLVRFAAAARHTPSAERRTWRALARRWALFGELLHEHHSKEDDALWPLLLERVDAAGDTVGRATLVAMEAEHDAIDPVLASVSDALGRLAVGTGSDAVRDRAATDLERAVAVLGDHLAHEERDAIALCQAHIDAEEWAELERTRLGAKPGPRLLLFLLPWISEGVEPAILAPLLDSGGAPLRVMLRLGGRSYRRLDRVAFAHVPPS